MIKMDIQFFADEIDSTSDPEIELEHSHDNYDSWEEDDKLSDHDIDDILGKENTDEEGLANSFFDENVDPRQRKGKKVTRFSKGKKKPVAGKQVKQDAPYYEDAIANEADDYSSEPYEHQEENGLEYERNGYEAEQASPVPDKEENVHLKQDFQESNIQYQNLQEQDQRILQNFAPEQESTEAVNESIHRDSEPQMEPDHAFWHDGLSGVVENSMGSLNEPESFRQEDLYWDNYSKARPDGSPEWMTEKVNDNYSGSSGKPYWDTVYNDTDAASFKGWDHLYDEYDTDIGNVRIAYSDTPTYNSREDGAVQNSLIELQEQIEQGRHTNPEDSQTYQERIPINTTEPIQKETEDHREQYSSSLIRENSNDDQSFVKPFNHDGISGKADTTSVGTQSSTEIPKMQATGASFVGSIGGLCGSCGQPVALCTCKKAERKENTDASSPDYVGETQKEAHRINKSEPYTVQTGNAKQIVEESVKNRMAGLGRNVYSKADVVEKSDDEASQGVRELKNSTPMNVLQMMTANSGANSTFSIDKVRNSNITGAMDKAEKLIAEGKLSLSDFESSGGIGTLSSIGKVSPIASVDILRYHKEIAENLKAKDLFMKYAQTEGCRFTQNELNFLKSKNFYSMKDAKIYNSMLNKVVRAYCPAVDGIDFTSISKAKMKKILKNPQAYGLTHDMVDALKKGMKINSFNAHKNRADGLGGKLGKIKRIGFSLTRRVLSADEGMANAINTASTVYTVGITTAKAAKVICKLTGKVTGLTALKNKVKQTINDKVVAPTKAKVSQTASSAKKAVSDKAKSGVKKATKKFGETSIGKGVNKATSAVKKASSSIANSKVGKGVKATAKTAKKAGKGAVTVTKKAAHTALIPGQLLGKVFDFLSQVKKWIFIIVGCIALIAVLGRMFLSFFAGIAGGISDTDMQTVSTEIVDTARGVQENVINYSYYKDLREDVQDILDKDEETMDKVLDLANGTPKNPNVWDGHTIDSYGFPGNANEEGEERLPYYIHYIDKDGNELLSQTTVAKDVESMAVAILRNEVGSYYSERKDLQKLDAMLEEMYGLCVWEDPETGLPFKYRESEPEACFEGCEEYDWVCYDEGAYDEYNRERGESVKFYGECESSLVPEYEELGCEPVEGEEIYDEYDEPTGEYEEDSPGCPGHTCRRCFGHKYVEIYVILLDIDSVVDAYRNGSLVIDFDYQVSGEHEHVEDAGYRSRWDEVLNNADRTKMTKDFIEKGAWDSNWSYESALAYKNPDPDTYGTWLDLYGIDPELGAGFGVSKGFSDEEIAEIVANMQIDGSVGVDQQKILEMAMSYVGKFKYMCNSTSHKNAYNGGESGYSECSGFVSGILKKAGYDRGNFSCADLKSKSVKSGTLTPGCVVTRIGYGNKSNHTMIYAGDAGNGRSYVIDCSSDAGGSAYRTVSNNYLAQYQYTFYPWQ